jgi:hypothetical protein
LHFLRQTLSTETLAIIELIIDVVADALLGLSASGVLRPQADGTINNHMMFWVSSKKPIKQSQKFSPVKICSRVSRISTLQCPNFAPGKSNFFSST